jgi:drug/metabolite transporter (DMT)-like permease
MRRHTGAMSGSRTSAARSGDLALVGAALCFGGTFLVVQDAVERVEPVPFLALRFSVGALALWPLARRRPARPGELRAGVAGGAALLTGYVLQTVGLQYTDSATSAFLTYLLVVFVPLLGLALHRRRPHDATLAGVVLAVVGLVLLTDPGDGTGIGRGEVLTLGCALAFAVHVLVVAATVGRHDPVRLAAIQVGVVGLACAGPGLLLGGYGFPLEAVVAAVATALAATALAFVLQLTGQRTVPPTRAALLLLLEPVFAGVLAGFTDEPLGAVQLAGAGVILLAIVLAELGPTWLDRSVRAREAGPDNDRSQGGPVA